MSTRLYRRAPDDPAADEGSWIRDLLIGEVIGPTVGPAVVAERPGVGRFVTVPVWDDREDAIVFANVWGPTRNQLPRGFFAEEWGTHFDLPVKKGRLSQPILDVLGEAMSSEVRIQYLASDTAKKALPPKLFTDKGKKLPPIERDHDMPAASSSAPPATQSLGEARAAPEPRRPAGVPCPMPAGTGESGAMDVEPPMPEAGTGGPPPKAPERRGRRRPRSRTAPEWSGIIDFSLPPPRVPRGSVPPGEAMPPPQAPEPIRSSGTSAAAGQTGSGSAGSGSGGGPSPGAAGSGGAPAGGSGSGGGTSTPRPQGTEAFTEGAR